MLRRMIFIAAILLGLVAFIHLLRLFSPFPVTIGSLHIPIEMSGPAFVISGALTAYLFRAGRNLNS